MEGILKVTPEHLLQTSGEFNNIGGQIRSLSEEMLSLIRGLSAVWEGEAAAAYGSKFDALSPDMDRLYRMVQEHVQDLPENIRRQKVAAWSREADWKVVSLCDVDGRRNQYGTEHLYVYEL